MIWTHNAVITEAVHPLLRILIIGTACNALVTIPYMTQLAYGWTKLGLYQNIIAIIILVPSIIYVAGRYGAYGAVWVWTLLNASYIVFSMPIMFKKILNKEIWRWYWNDVFLIILVSLIPMIFFRLIFNYFNPVNTWVIFIYCGCAFSIVLLFAVLSAKYTREFISNLYQRSVIVKPVRK